MKNSCQTQYIIMCHIGGALVDSGVRGVVPVIHAAELIYIELLCY